MHQQPRWNCALCYKKAQELQEPLMSLSSSRGTVLQGPSRMLPALGDADSSLACLGFRIRVSAGLRDPPVSLPFPFSG